MDESAEPGDIVYIVWELTYDNRDRRIRTLYAIAATYAGARLAAPAREFEIEEYRLK